MFPVLHPVEDFPTPLLSTIVDHTILMSITYHTRSHGSVPKSNVIVEQLPPDASPTDPDKPGGRDAETPSEDGTGDCQGPLQHMLEERPLPPPIVDMAILSSDLLV